MGRWHCPGPTTNQADSDQAARHGEESDAGRPIHPFSRNRGLKRHAIPGIDGGRAIALIAAVLATLGEYAG